MRLHLLSLPHTQANSRYLSCAYTQKVVKFCKMMGDRHEILLYAGDESEVENVSEQIVCVTEAERRHWFGQDHFDTVRTPFAWDDTKVYWKTFAERAIPALRRRARPKDLLLVTGGSCQASIARSVPHLYPVEWAVGYEGIFANQCAFESYAWMHEVYGKRKIINGRCYDAVVPNFFDTNDFLAPKDRGDDYLLYLGRVTLRKGPHVAAAIAERLGMKLVVAGPGGDRVSDDLLMGGDGCAIRGAHVEYVGEVGRDARAVLLQNASCLLVPTIYNEPFGGVAVEAMLSGCPVVASDWGAFTETVTPEVGRRFRILREGASAVEEAMRLDRRAVAESARARFSLEAVGPMFDRWFERLSTLWGVGWAAD